MLANVDQLAPRPATAELPTVSYDADRKEIRVTLICSMTEDNGCKTQPPMIALPGVDVWTVIWTLVPGPGVTSATFAEVRGIDCPWPQGTHLPEKVDIQFSEREPEPATSQWKWEVLFTTSKDLDAAVFHYGINAYFNRANGSRGRILVQHDPTIVVTKDPIEGG